MRRKWIIFKRWLLCDILGWHYCKVVKPSGINMLGVCHRCSRKCMLDSQGIWFEY